MTRTLGALALLVALAVVLSARPVAPSHVEVMAINRNGVSGTWLGFTQCEGFPASFVNVTESIARPELLSMVVAHEKMHREQAARYGSCEAWKAAKLSDPQVTIDHEAEAHCVSAQVRYEEGAHPSLLLAMIEQAGWFSWYFWNGDMRPALDEIAKWCG